MAVQNTHKTLAAVAALAVSAAAPAHAEGLELGGYIIAEGLYDTSGFTDAELDFDLVIGYRSGPFYVGVGQFIETDLDNSDLFNNPDQPYIMFGYDAFLATYGEVQGAGNMFPEDYFGFDETTDQNSNMLRLDYAPGGDSSIIQHVALSYDMDDSDLHDAIEIGLRLAVGGMDIGIGYEGDAEELGVIVAKDFGDIRLHGVAHLDPGDNDYDIGLSAFQMFGDVELGAHVEFEPTDNNGNLLDAVALIAYYETGIGTLSGQVRHEFPANSSGDTIVELGLVIPFGDSAPYAAERMTTSENTRRFGF